MKKLFAFTLFAFFWLLGTEDEPVDIDYATLRFKIRNARSLDELEAYDTAIDDFECRYRGSCDTHKYFTTLQQEMSEATRRLMGRELQVA